MISDERLWNEAMQCFVLRIEVDFQHHRAIARLAEHNCCDMYGAIETVQSLDPQVREIHTFSGTEPDTVYFLSGKEWHAVLPERLRARPVPLFARSC